MYVTTGNCIICKYGKYTYNSEGRVVPESTETLEVEVMFVNVKFPVSNAIVHQAKKKYCYQHHFTCYAEKNCFLNYDSKHRLF